MHSVYVDPAAELDIRSAFEWYESKRIGLGAEFIDELDKSIEAIAYSPESRAVVEENARLALVKRFPYVICYLFERDIVHIIAVFHGHRDSSVWQGRLL